MALSEMAGGNGIITAWHVNNQYWRINDRRNVKNKRIGAGVMA